MALSNTYLDNIKTSNEKLLGNLPTKAEFFSSVDKIMRELKTIREGIAILSVLPAKIDDLDRRLVKVEKILQIAS